MTKRIPGYRLWKKIPNLTLVHIQYLPRHLTHSLALRGKTHMTDKNSISYWLPLLQTAGVKTPKTILVYTDIDFTGYMDGRASAEQTARLGLFCDELQRAALKLGGFPVFLRTGHTSDKHSWYKTCLLFRIEDIASHVLALAEFSYLADMMGLPTDVWAMRELLPTEPIFTLRHGMPVNKERRYFVRDGKVICHHPYWPQDAVQEHFVVKKSLKLNLNAPIKRAPPCHDWKKKLAAANAETDAEIAELMTLSTRVSRVVPGAWSVDWLWTKNGWYCIDMALAAESFHWPGCAQAGTFGEPR